MRRFTIGSAMVLALLLMLTAIATAAPPNCEELPFEHPHYCGPPPSSTTTSTTTTAVPEPSTLEPCGTGFEFEGLKPGQVEYECLWTPEDPGTVPVVGKVTVTPTDGISRLLVFVRDSSPGDICLLAQNAEDQTGPDGSFVGSFDLSYEALPIHDDWDVPYPSIFNEYLEQTYWSFDYFDAVDENGTHWCYPQDEIEGMREDLNGPPLHLWVKFFAKRNAGPVVVTLSVEPKS